jgi:hypothetical protein
LPITSVTAPLVKFRSILQPSEKLRPAEKYFPFRFQPSITPGVFTQPRAVLGHIKLELLLLGLMLRLPLSALGYRADERNNQTNNYQEKSDARKPIW